MKKTLSLVICCALLLGLLSGCGDISIPFIGGGEDHVKQNSLPAAEVSLSSVNAAENELRAAVLYDGSAGTGYWEDTCSRLCQPLLLGLEAEAVDVSGEYSLEDYDLLYPDESIIGSEKAESLKDEITAFAEAGGGVFLTNGFYDFFDKDLIGAKSFHEVEDYPYLMDYPEVDDDLAELQEITRDFYTLYEAYTDFPELEGLERGMALKPSTAVALCTRVGYALSTMNMYGEGYVFFASGLLPNPYCISGTMLEQRDDGQRYLSDTAMSAARLLENAFASFYMKRTVGYSAWRVYGSFGSPAMSWELHFEELGGFADGSGVAFAELCKEYGQIPSYTLVRNSYTWFERVETVSSLLGQEGGRLRFSMELNENAYSSGAHVAAGDEWLTLASIEDGGSYFEDYPEFELRAYPDVYDLDGDGKPDIVCGSSDGRLYFYRGLGYKSRLLTEEAAPLTDSEGRQLSVSGYSAPVVCDFDGDGEADILCGAQDGKVYLFRGLGELTFEAGVVVADTGIEGQVFPDWGDLNGDGVDDLVCGSNSGKLLVLYGTESGLPESGFTELSVFGVDGDWLCPRIYDINGDGIQDLLLGTFDGYVAKLLNQGVGGFASAGFIELDEMNYKGNYNAKFGNNCVPVVADINGDGIDDLICGSLEYGASYPIDSEYFPYKSELMEQIKYFRDNYIYVGAHFYTTACSSAEREAYELQRHLESLKLYGVVSDKLGANQHTWYTSSLSQTQTFLSLWKAGFLWNTGYAAPGDLDPYPQASARNVISLPFFLTQDGKWTILLQNCCTMLYGYDEWTDISARYGMPMCVYYHCDFTAQDDTEAIASIEQVQAFREKFGYSFVMENQLASACAAAINLSLDIVGNSEENFDIELVGSGQSNTFPLYSGNYQISTGVRLSLGTALQGRDIRTDADVWHRDGSDLYIGLNRPVRVYEAAEGASEQGAHIERVNLPATISTHEGGASVSFLSNGYMEVETSAPATTQSSGWTAKQLGDGGTLFYKYGAASALIISYGE